MFNQYCSHRKMRQSDYVTHAYRLIPCGKSRATFIPCHIDRYQIPPPLTGFPLAVLVIFSSILYDYIMHVTAAYTSQYRPAYTAS